MDVAQLASHTIIVYFSAFRFDWRGTTGVSHYHSFLFFIRFDGRCSTGESHYQCFYFSSISMDVAQLPSHTITIFFSSCIFDGRGTVTPVSVYTPLSVYVDTNGCSRNH